MGKNPEAQYRRYRPDYSGMALRELTFCTMPDLFGHPVDLQTDLITTCGDFPDRPLPVVIFVHGGGFIEPNDKRQAYISLFARQFTAAGYAVLSPDYPQYEDQEQMDACGDTLQAMRTAGEAVHRLYEFVAREGGSLGLDPGRVVLMGGSAGGMAGFYAIADHPQDRYRLFGNLWGAPEPMPSLHGFPPVISVHGTADPLVPFAREEPLQRELERLGIPHTLITLEGAGHTPLGRMDTFLPPMMNLLTQTMQ